MMPTLTFTQKSGLMSFNRWPIGPRAICADSRRSLETAEKVGFWSFNGKPQASALTKVVCRSRRRLRLAVKRLLQQPPLALRFNDWLRISCFFILLVATSARADDRATVLSDADAQNHLRQLCIECHNSTKTEGKMRLDLPPAQFSEKTWDKVVQALHHLDMPPVEAKQQPSKEVRTQLEAWAQGHLDRHILKRAGDPGEVAWRRLTTIELDNMIRELTGQNISVREVLGQDTTGGEGFSNIGTAQSSMTASLLDKYLAMSSRVAEHARFDVDGKLVFDAPEAIVSPQVREDQAIIDLQKLSACVLGGMYLGPGQSAVYGKDGREVRGSFVRTEQGWRGPGQYLTAIWLATAAPDPQAALPALAERLELNPRYLDYVWQMWGTCEAGSLEHMLWVGPLQALPKPASLDQEPPEVVRRTCDAVGSAFWQVLRQHNNGVIPRDKNRAEGFPCTVSLLFTAINGQRIQNRTSKKTPVNEVPVFVGVHAADGSSVVLQSRATNVYLGLPQIRITETRTEKVNGKDQRTTSVSWQPLPTDSLEPLPANQKWVEHAFAGFDNEPRSLPALAFRSSVILRIDLAAVDALKGKVFGADGQFHKGVTVDVVFPVDVGGHDGLWRVSISRDRKDLDLAEFTELVRFPAGKADGIEHTWLAADRATSDAYREQFAEMAQRWPPLAPLQMAPFGSTRTQEVPPEMAYFRDDARMQERAMNDAERKQADALWRYTFMLCGEHDRRMRRLEERFGLSEADRKKENDVREILATRTPEGREPNHGHGVAPYDYVKRWEYYHRAAAEDAAFWRKQTLAAVEDFATRAWRRPLTENEVTQFAAAYDRMGSMAARDAELVLRAMLARVLLSPHFVYRVERIAADGEESPLLAWELANRLSMTLWASLPDEELRRCAADGSILRDEVLRAQTRRMLADPRAGGTGLAEHFFGQWLGFAGFGTATRGPDTSVFPDFTPQVRRSLHHEAIAYCEDLIRNDRDVRLMIDGDYSFLDETLRGYYGVNRLTASRRRLSDTENADASGLPLNENAFERTDMRPAGRGGVLGLGAILINNSRQKRTSPTNRGVWVVEKLLGRHIPAPPPNVDPLPDEPQTNKSLSLLEQIRRHSNEPACASCHQRIDPYGYSLEAFDAIGRLRPQEFIDKLTFAEDRDGRRIGGMEGLQSYLRDHEDEVLHSMTRHFIGYALNRGTLVSDRPLIDKIVKELPGSEYRFSTIVEHVVLSRQFRFHR